MYFISRNDSYYPPVYQDTGRPLHWHCHFEQLCPSPFSRGRTTKVCSQLTRGTRCHFTSETCETIKPWDNWCLKVIYSFILTKHILVSNMHLRNTVHLLRLHLMFSWWILFSGTAELFATCAKKDIRVWHTLSNRELLRITVPNMTCHGIDFMKDGKSIISGNTDLPRLGFGLWRGFGSCRSHDTLVSTCG